MLYIDISKNGLKLFKLIMFMLLTAHISGCIFFTIAKVHHYKVVNILFLT